jgi:hypothetical protein
MFVVYFQYRRSAALVLFDLAARRNVRNGALAGEQQHQHSRSMMRGACCLLLLSMRYRHGLGGAAVSGLYPSSHSAFEGFEEEG